MGQSQGCCGISQDCNRFSDSAPRSSAVASTALPKNDDDETFFPQANGGQYSLAGTVRTHSVEWASLSAQTNSRRLSHTNDLERAIEYGERGEHVQAEPLLRKACADLETKFGLGNELTIKSISFLAECLTDQGKHTAAEPFHQKAFELGDLAFGHDHPDTLRFLAKFHTCLCKLGKRHDAETLDARSQQSEQRRSSVVGQSVVQPNNSNRRVKTRKSFHGFLLTREKTDSRESLVLITDPGQDNDDEMALLLLGELNRRSEVDVMAVIANLQPANRRAALVRGTLDMLGMYDVPVGIGSDGGSTTHTDTFSQYISDGMTGFDYISPQLEAVAKVEDALGTSQEKEVSEQHRIFDGQRLFKNVLERADNKAVTLVLLSSLKDAAQFLRSHEALFVAKLKCVTIMGGMDAPTNGSTSPFLEPSDAHNNMFDFPAAQFFYRRCQELGVPLVVLSRFAAYGCPVQKKVYDLMVRHPVPHPTVCRLQRAQRNSIQSLWQNVCAGGKLPARCDKEWFCDTFCCGEGAERTSQDSMWDLVRTFNMYDPLAVLAAFQSRRESFFHSQEHVGPQGTLHLNIGTNKDNNGILPDSVNDLHDFLLTTWIRAAGRSRNSGEHSGEESRPKQLDSEQLTAALTPMVTHTSEELSALNADVLNLIDHEWPKLKNSSWLGTWRDRDRLMKSIGPPMLLVDPALVERLGRIPHSAEEKAIQLEEAANISDREDKRFFIEMFSHRWHSRYSPDDRFNNKARILVEWGKYRASMKLRTFFWIDYACINQSDIGPGVAMLPLYVSCCNNIVCYDTPPYEPRAWCRIERLMFSSFVAPNNEYIDPDFEYNPNAETLSSGELKPSYEGKLCVPDPSGPDAQLSFAGDSDLIFELKDLCTTHWGKCWKDGLMDICEEKGGLKDIRSLTYGCTEVRLRKFI